MDTEEIKAQLKETVDEHWLEAIQDLKARGLTEHQIADHLDISVSMLRTGIAIVKDARNNKEKDEHVHAYGPLRTWTSNWVMDGVQGQSLRTGRSCTIKNCGKILLMPVNDTRRLIDRVFLMGINKMKQEGKTEAEIAEELSVSVSKLRAAVAIIKSEINEDNKEN